MKISQKFIKNLQIVKISDKHKKFSQEENEVRNTILSKNLLKYIKR
jgi:hypothetical protein